MFIFVKTKQIGEKIKNLRTNLRYIVNSELKSIWLRDFASFNMDDKIVKPIFYYEDNSNIALKINKSMRTLNYLLKKRLVDIDLIWDGGNLVTNGEIGFITERIIQDNKKKYTRKQIEKIIKDTLKINPVLITEFEEDELAHADGYMAFINENTVLISEYTDNKLFEKDNEYVDGIERIIKELKINLKIVRIKDNPVDDKPYCGGIASAKGIYINFLMLNDTIIMPEYKYKNSKDNKFNKINYEILAKLGFNVIKINCDDLAKFGGVLHCISFTN